MANVVLVKKNSGKWRMCVDYTDLNKACPKDSYPLPSIDRLVDEASGHALLSFLEAYSVHTSFITDHANYCYRVMPFGLKNTGATYQRLMDKVFHRQIGRNMEVYVDDMVDKTTSAIDHVADLAEIFAQVRKHNMRLNPEKCVFVVQGGKFPGFMITSRGIEANPVPTPEVGVTFRNTCSPSANSKGLCLFTKRPGQHRTIIQETLHSPSLDDRVVSVSDNEDLGWMAGIWGYFKEGILPGDKDEARKIRMRSAKFIIVGDELFKRGVPSPLLKCLTASQAAYVIKEIHQGICGMHSGARSMATRILRPGYYWPTLKSDYQSHIQKCKECQQFGNEHRQPPETLHHMMSAWPFSQQWLDELPSILWAYHYTPQSTTQETPYRMTYGADAMIPVEVGETSHKRQVFNGEQNAQELLADLDLVDELRDEAQSHEEACKLRASRRYNTRVKPRSFRVGDLVWRLRGEARKDTSDGKLAPTWGGPFRVTENLENGAYRLEELSGKPIPRTWNATHLKFYFS
uniref:Retrovirus-related Pol polyprotein from transposon 297 family n=1 Tax=Cajanus cajan TaxID=3821 RepID=A0A151RKP9_CAJCA|nr:Retrovirus-related Pol polyprotein from transposon 297 family [Cajanus cajan]